jgi:hypothetical protein
LGNEKNPYSVFVNPVNSFCKEIEIHSEATVIVRDAFGDMPCLETVFTHSKTLEIARVDLKLQSNIVLKAPNYSAFEKYAVENDIAFEPLNS